MHNNTIDNNTTDDNNTIDDTDMDLDLAWGNYDTQPHPDVEEPQPDVEEPQPGDEEVDDEYSKHWFKNAKKYMDSYDDVDIFLPLVVDVDGEQNFLGFTKIFL